MKTAKGILLTYDIRELREKRRHCLSLRTQLMVARRLDKVLMPAERGAAGNSE